MNGETWQTPPRGAIHRGWRYTIETGHHRDEDVTDEDVPEIRDALVAALKAARDYDRQDHVGDELREITDEFSGVDTVEWFDQMLSELYDWGDAYRVIIRSF